MPHLGDDPVARRRRSERPSSSVRPQPNLAKMESATAASWRPQRVALPTALRAARLEEREIFRCRALAMTP